MKCLDLPEVLPLIPLMYRDAKRKWTGLRFVVLSTDQSAFVFKIVLTFRTVVEIWIEDFFSNIAGQLLRVNFLEKSLFQRLEDLLWVCLLCSMISFN